MLEPCASRAGGSRAASARARWRRAGRAARRRGWRAPMAASVNLTRAAPITARSVRSREKSSLVHHEPLAPHIDDAREGASMSTAVDVARAGAADMISVNPSSPHAKKRAPARRGVVPSDEVDVAVDGTPRADHRGGARRPKRARSRTTPPCVPCARSRTRATSPSPCALAPPTPRRVIPPPATPRRRGAAVRRHVVPHHQCRPPSPPASSSAPRGERSAPSPSTPFARATQKTSPRTSLVVRAFDTLAARARLRRRRPTCEGQPDAALAANGRPRSLRRGVPSGCT